MSLFKKPIKFISAVCPKCNGNLEIDPHLERAFCQYCGAQCIIENAPKSQRKQNKLETVLDFFERQQSLHRQDKKEQQRYKQENAENEKKEKKKIFLALRVHYRQYIHHISRHDNFRKYRHYLSTT